MSRSNQLDLFTVAVAGLVAAVIAAMPMLHPGLRVVAGSALVLVLPGYALAAALVPVRPLPIAERTALVLVLNLTVTIALGFILNLTVGLHPETWAFALGGITLIGGVVGISRRRDAARLSPAFQASRPSQHGALPAPRTMLLVSVAVCIAALSVGIATAGLETQPRLQFTQFWMVPASSESSAPAVEQTLEVGIANHEADEQRYAVTIDADGEVVASVAEIRLAPGETWDETFRVPLGEGEARPVTARLGIADQPDVTIRQVTVWVAAP